MRHRAWRVLAAALALAGCGPSSAGDARGPDVGDGGLVWRDAARDRGVGDGAENSAGDNSIGDLGAREAGPFVPKAGTAELIFSGPAGNATPPTWNAHLPKLVADASYYYAVHTHFTPGVATRFAAILRRPLAGGTWIEAARIGYVHQPPGMVVDTAERLHLIFDCLRPAGAAVTCFQGGAGTGALSSRFYHLVFSARSKNKALRFDTYANHNEWTAESNGYLGIGTTADGLTFWSLADSSWGRVLQYQTATSATGTIGTLTVPKGYLLYPIMAASPQAPTALLLFAGEFDPGGGNNASYLAATAYHGNLAGLSQLFRRTPATPMPGKVGAYPSAIAFEPDGEVSMLAHRVDGGGGCTELWRFDGGLGVAPTVLPAGCHGTYTKLQISSAGTFYLLAATGGGASIKLGISADRGASWSWHTVPLLGLPKNGDAQYFGMTPITSFSAPNSYDPDRLRFLFSGYDAAKLARHSYFGEITLAP